MNVLPLFRKKRGLTGFSLLRGQEDRARVQDTSYIFDMTRYP